MGKLIAPVIFNLLLLVGLIIGLTAVQPIGMLAYTCLHIPALVWLGWSIRGVLARQRKHVVMVSDDELSRIRGKAYRG